MSFRKYGGLNYAATNNIVRNHYFNSDNQTISNVLGEENSKIVSMSHVDLSGNYLMQTEGIYFMDGTLQTTAYITDPGTFDNLQVTGYLTVGTTSTFGGNATFNSDVSVGGTLTVTTLNASNLSYTNLEVSGYLTVGTTSTFGGVATFSSTASFNCSFIYVKKYFISFHEPSGCCFDFPSTASSVYSVSYTSVSITYSKNLKSIFAHSNSIT
jgi:hypothetical protein